MNREPVNRSFDLSEDVDRDKQDDDVKEVFSLGKYINVEGTLLWFCFSFSLSYVLMRWYYAKVRLHIVCIPRV